MSNSTLTSLAMLKVNIDQGNDYFDYLRPFILHVLVEKKPDPVTDHGIADLIHEQFGLKIPNKSVQLVIRRLTKKKLLNKDHGVVRISGNLPNPEIPEKRTEAELHINSVVQGLIEYSKKSARELPDADSAITAICAFLLKFDIQCLSSYLRGTAIPDLEGSHDTDIVLVSQYVFHLQQSNPERFKSLLLMVQGHMLANALLCPDLRDLPKTYTNVTFYFDTPLLIHSIGLEGQAKEAAANELIRLLLKLGGNVATFSHSMNELKNVLYGAAAHIDDSEPRGEIIAEARRNGTTKSDLHLLANQIDDILEEKQIVTISSPQYIEAFQIDEAEFGQELEDEVSYFNERTKEFDINSVRSIYALRKNTSPTSIENSGAILVTSNSAFAKAAWNFGQKHDTSQQVSSVITDYVLANLAWLKAPMQTEEIPTKELLAISFAALQPSKSFLKNFLDEIHKLLDKGNISERDHQLLRSDIRVHEELMSLTLGDEASLTEGTIAETLERVTKKIKKEESNKLEAEKGQHHQTKEFLESLSKEKQQMSEEKQQIRKYLRLRCERSAKIYAWISTSVIFSVLLVGTVSGFKFGFTLSYLENFIATISVLIGIFTLGNLVFGITLKGIHQYLQRKFHKNLLKRESDAIGINLSVKETDVDDT